MPLKPSEAGEPPPEKVPELSRLPLICKAAPASRYPPLLPIDSSPSVFVPPVCWNKAVAPEA